MAPNFTELAISALSVADLLEEDSTVPKAMDSAQLCGHMVLHVPAINLTAEEHALIGAELDTEQPFDAANTRFGLAVRDAGARALRFVKGGQFYSRSVRAAAKFLARPMTWLPSPRWLLGVMAKVELSQA